MADFSRPVVWINKHELLPDTCITCGMFTDSCVTAKSVQQHQRAVSSGEVNSRMALGCMLHFLGPFGWMVAAMLSGGESDQSTQKTVTTRSKVRIPCCRLCAGQQIPKPVRSNAIEGRFEFEVHVRFQERLVAMRKEKTEALARDQGQAGR